jgi:lipoate-protein ligase A
MHFLDLTMPSLSANLALDEALLLSAEEGQAGEVLRFWQWPAHAVVLGAAGIAADDVHEAACEADSVPLARRSSGGGTVLLGPGCLCFTLVLDQKRAVELTQISSSYRWILQRVGDSLAALQPGIAFAGTSDLVVAGRKFSGNSQQRKRRFILHHGTLLCGFYLEKVGRYLKLPPRRPEYRGKREHAEFLMNLPDMPDAIRECLRTAWHAHEPLLHRPQEIIAKLVEEKYDRQDWIRRR